MATATSITPGQRNRIALQTMRDEVSHERLPVSGAMPDWLTGTLLRLSVCDFRSGVGRVNHLFDGLAMVHKFSFADGQVNYANRALDTAARRSRDAGKLTLSEFGTEPCRSRFKRFTTLFRPTFTDNANVNVVRLGQEFLALTELPLPVAFDRETLAAAGVSDSLPPGSKVPSHTTAHPHHDRANGALVAYFTRFGPRSHYEIHETFAAEGGSNDRLVAKMAAPRPSYMHSFAITDRYAVIQENPLRVNPLKLATAGKPFIENFHWNGDEGSLFHVFDRGSGERVGSWQADSFFCFHHINAFESGDEIVVDLVAHDDAGVIESLYLDAMESNEFTLRPTKLRRFRLRPGGRVESELLTDKLELHLELPRINYRDRNKRDYRYVYGTGFVATGPGAPELSKIDVASGEIERWSEHGCYPGEPVFVPAPDAKTEDDGVVLSVVLDSERVQSYLLVLDGQTFQERARAEMPHRTPLSFHGNFFS